MIRIAAEIAKIATETAASPARTGGAGGSGIVIIRYKFQ